MTLAYRVGTVAVTNASAAVTGTGTTWTSQVKPGDWFTLDGTRMAEVLSVASNTSLTLTTVWGGSTASGQAYSIARVSPLWSDASAVAIKLAEYFDALALFPTPAAPDALKLLRANALGTAYEFSAAPVVARETLTAARTYWVRADGNDANNGLANSSGGAFRQIQKAIDTVAGLDLMRNAVTIAVADGAYAPIILRAVTGGGTVAIVGNTALPANVTIAASSTNAITADGVSGYDIRGIKVSTSGNGNGVSASNSRLTIGQMEYGVCVDSHILASDGGSIRINASYRVSGAATAHWQAVEQARIVGNSNTITIVGTPGFSSGWAVASRLGEILQYSNAFVGSATGAPYWATSNAVIETFGATLPGSAAGIIASGGQFH